MSKKKQKMDLGNKEWKTIIDFTKIREGGVSLQELLKILDKIDN